MRIVIAGPGALGCLLAARISTVLQAGDELTLLDHRRDRAGLLNRDGFTLEDGGKSEQFIVPATADPTTISGCDLFFLCTRSEDVDTAVVQAESLLTSNTLLISMQRGISHLQTVESSSAIAAAAVSSADIFLNSGNTICCLDSGTIDIGLLAPTAGASPRLEQAVDLLNRAGLQTATTAAQDTRKQLWDSFLIDLAVNALAAIYRRPNGQLLTSCSVRGNMKKILTEAVEVGKAVGIETTGDPVKMAFQFLRTEKKRIAPMLRAVDNRRPTEIDALNGTIVGLGKQAAIPTPTNEDLVLRIKKLEGQYL